MLPDFCIIEVHFLIIEVILAKKWSELGVSHSQKEKKNTMLEGYIGFYGEKSTGQSEMAAEERMKAQRCLACDNSTAWEREKWVTWSSYMQKALNKQNKKLLWHMYSKEKVWVVLKAADLKATPSSVRKVVNQ